jgi:hypothetical protein
MIGLCIERLLSNNAVVKNNHFIQYSNTVMIDPESDQEGTGEAETFLSCIKPNRVPKLFFFFPVHTKQAVSPTIALIESESIKQLTLFYLHLFSVFHDNLDL